jgi:hypothetical protein
VKRRNPSKPEPSSEFLLPQPSPEGVARMRALYRKQTGKEITEEEARDVLYRIMRWQYVNYLINTAHAVRGEGGPFAGALVSDVGSDDEAITTQPGQAAGDSRGETGSRRTRGTGPFGLPRRPG